MYTCNSKLYLPKSWKEKSEKSKNWYRVKIPSNKTPSLSTVPLLGFYSRQIYRSTKRLMYECSLQLCSDIPYNIGSFLRLCFLSCNTKPTVWTASTDTHLWISSVEFGGKRNRWECKALDVYMPCRMKSSNLRILCLLQHLWTHADSHLSWQVKFQN